MQNDLLHVTSAQKIDQRLATLPYAYETQNFQTASSASATQFKQVMRILDVHN